MSTYNPPPQGFSQYNPLDRRALPLVLSIGCFILIILSIRCGIGDRKRQEMWRVNVLNVKDHVQQYVMKNGRLPATLEEVFQTPEEKLEGQITIDNRTLDIQAWAHYKQLSDTKYVLWISGKEIEDGFASIKDGTVTGEPGPGDVYAKCDVTGALVETSWGSLK